MLAPSLGWSFVGLMEPVRTGLGGRGAVGNAGEDGTDPVMPALILWRNNRRVIATVCSVTGCVAVISTNSSSTAG